VFARRLLLIAVGLSLAGCSGWLEEQRKLGARQQDEADLIATIESGDVARTRALLEKDRSLANSVRMVRGRRTDRRAETALTLSAKKGRSEIVAVLLGFGADPRLVDSEGTLPLGAAFSAEDQRLEIATLLLKAGADPDQADGSGRTALHHAAGFREEETEPLLALLAKATSVGARDHRGWTPLHGAASANNLAAMRLLVERGADLNATTGAPQDQAGMPDDVPGTTPLALVARDRQIRSAATLCALGADPQHAGAGGVSARDVAARRAQKEGAKPSADGSDLARHWNMAEFLARGGGCDALLARSRRGERIAAVEVARIANESECAAGWGWACGQAGWAFHRGEGARLDKARAYALFRRACHETSWHDPWSCGMTGIFHVDGIGIPEDPTEGARWLKLGCEPARADRSDEQACNRLGLLHAEGNGVPKDVTRARSLFKRACDARYERACANLNKHSGG